MTPELAVFDRAAFMERIGDDEELLIELIGDFLQQIPAWHDDIRSKIEKDDADGLRRAAHAMKGAALSMAIDRVAHAAKALEEAGVSGEIGNAAELFRALESESDAARDVLSKEEGVVEKETDS